MPAEIDASMGKVRTAPWTPRHSERLRKAASMIAMPSSIPVESLCADRIANEGLLVFKFSVSREGVVGPIALITRRR